MPIPILDKLISGFGGEILDASLVEMASGDSAETTIVNIGMSIVAWNFDATTTDGTNPGASNLALNNALKDNATAINFNTTSAIDSARFDEMLAAQGEGNRIFIQERDATNTSILYRVTGPAVLDGTRVDVPVVRERDQGGEFTDNALLNVLFIAASAASSVRLQTTTVDATSPSTFASSMSGVTIRKGFAYEITSAGEPFTDETVLAAVGDWLVAEVDDASLTTVASWSIIRTATSLPLPTVQSAQFLGQVTLTGASLFNFSDNVQILDRNLRNVTLPVNAPYDQAARLFFGGSTIETDEVSDRVEYSEGYSLGIDYRDNAEGAVNDATHFVDTAITVVGNLASNTFTYPASTTFQRLISMQIQLNTGLNGVGAMVVLLTDGSAVENEFVHIALDNTIEVDTDPISGSGTHVTVQDGLGNVVLDDGSWVLLEIVPSSNGVLNNFDVIPAVIKADGTRIDCNDIVVDLGGLDPERLGLSRSQAQRGEITQFKVIQLPGYLRHSQLHNLFDHVADKWCWGFARLYESGGEEVLTIIHKLKGPLQNTLTRDITDTAIGGAGNATLTLPDDYTDFEHVEYTVVEDGGQTTNHLILTRTLEDAASIANLRISGNDSAAWTRSARTIVLDTTADTWTRAILAIPRP